MTNENQNVIETLAQTVNQLFSTIHEAADHYINTSNSALNSGILKSTPIAADVILDMTVGGKNTGEAGARLVGRELLGAGAFITVAYATKGRSPHVAFFAREFIMFLGGDHAANASEWVYNRYINPQAAQTALQNDLTLLPENHTVFTGLDDGSVVGFERVNGVVSAVDLSTITEQDLSQHFSTQPALSPNSSTIVLNHADDQGNSIEYTLDETGNATKVKVTQSSAVNLDTIAADTAAAIAGDGGDYTLQDGAVIETRYWH